MLYKHHWWKNSNYSKNERSQGRVMEGCEPQRQTKRRGVCSKKSAADPFTNAYFKKF